MSSLLATARRSLSTRLREHSVLGRTFGTSRIRGPATIHDLPVADRWRWIAVDAVALLVLLALVCVAFWPLYGVGWLWMAGMGGAVLGVVIGIAGAWQRWPAWIVAVVAACAHLLFGSMLAMPQLAGASVLPTARTLSGLVFGVVQTWKRVLTMDAPIGTTDNLLVLPLLTLLVAGILGVTLATRSGRPGLAWLPPALALVVAIAFGLQTGYRPVAVGIAFFVVALLWTAYRRDYQRQTLLTRRRRYSLRTVLSAVGMLLVAGLVAGLVSPLVTPDTRHVLRDTVEPPLDVRQWPSPLQSFRSNVKDHRHDVLFTVDGLPTGAGIRLATLDAYDGITVNASSSVSGAPGGGTYKRIGSRVPDDTPGTSISYTVTIGDYRGRWVPTVGKTLALEFTGDRDDELSGQFFYNRTTGSGVSTLPLQAGDRYRVDAVVPVQPNRSEVRTASAGDVDLPSASPIAEELAARAREWTAGVTTDGEAAIRLEEKLRQAYYSHGLANDVPSLPGHSSYRMMTLMTDHEGRPVGDEEQYAVAMALMAREVGLPSRVVYGYRPTSNGTVEVVGDNVSAWVEINFDRLGWVEFFPTPDKSRALPQDTTHAESKPRPQVENPPPPPERPEEPPPDNTPPLPGEEDQEDPAAIDWAAVLRVVLAVLVPLLLIAGPLLAVMAIKARRRRLRRGADSPFDRVAGGWAELLDRARDLGAAPSRAATRSENAAAVAARFPTALSVTPPSVLAHRADWASFSGHPPTAAMVDEYWSDVTATGQAMARTVSPWRRFVAAISLRSLLGRDKAARQ